MTPIVQFWGRFLPKKLVFLAVSITYAAMLISVVSVLGYDGLSQVIYLDIQKGFE